MLRGFIETSLQKNRQPYRLPNPLNAGESSVNNIRPKDAKVKLKTEIFIILTIQWCEILNIYCYRKSFFKGFQISYERIDWSRADKTWEFFLGVGTIADNDGYKFHT